MNWAQMQRPTFGRYLLQSFMAIDSARPTQSDEEGARTVPPDTVKLDQGAAGSLANPGDDVTRLPILRGQQLLGRTDH